MALCMSKQNIQSFGSQSFPECLKLGQTMVEKLGQTNVEKLGQTIVENKNLVYACVAKNERFKQVETNSSRSNLGIIPNQVKTPNPRHRTTFPDIQTQSMTGLMFSLEASQPQGCHLPAVQMDLTIYYNARDEPIYN